MQFNQISKVRFINKNKLFLHLKEHFFKLLHGIRGVLDGVSNDGGVIVNFKVVSAFGRFIAKEVNFTEVVSLQVTQTEGLIPALREGIDGDLSTDRILQTVIGEFGFEGLDQVGANVIGLVEGFKGEALFVAAIATDWGNVDHGVAEFNEASTLNGNVKVGNVSKDEVNQFLVFFLTQKPNEALNVNKKGFMTDFWYFISDLFTVFEGGGSVFREAKIKKMCGSVLTELLLLLGEIRSTDVPNDALLFQFL